MTDDRHTRSPSAHERYPSTRALRGLLAAIAVVLPLAGCARSRSLSPPPDRQVLAKGPLQAFTVAESPGVDSGVARIQLEGSINETLSFQLLIAADRRPLRRLRLTCAPLASSQGPPLRDAVTMYHMVRVDIDRLPGWHLRTIPLRQRQASPSDALVPLDAPYGGLPESVEPFEAARVWVDVHIPKGAAEGEYTTRVDLSAAGKKVGEVQVALTVWPMVLPDEPIEPIVAELDHELLQRHHPAARQFDALLRDTMRVLQEHRLTPVLHQASPLVRIDRNGYPELDWTQYDRLVVPFLSGDAYDNRVAPRLWPLPGQAVLVGALTESTDSSDAQARLLQRYLSAAAAHFRDRGWLDRSYAVLPTAATLDKTTFARDRRFAELARKVEPRVRVASRLWPQDMTPYGWEDYPGVGFDPPVDAWMPPAQFYDVAGLALAQKRGREAWLTLDRPPFGGSLDISAPPAYVRVITWLAARLGASAIHLGCINRWPASATASTPESCVRVDPTVLLYPGSPFGLDHPVASVRLKHLRASAQDSAYRRLSFDRGQKHIAQTLTDSLVAHAGSDAYRTHFADGRPIGWVDDLPTFELAREIMADEVRRGGEETLQRLDNLARTTRWRRFMLATGRVRIGFDGARVRLRGPQRSREAAIECTITLANESRTPVAGTVRFEQVPSGWNVETAGVTVTKMTPGQSRRVMLTATAPALPATPGATVDLPVVFTTDQQKVHRCLARISLVTAVPLGDTIRVDGDLSDWPPGVDNVGGGFLSVARQSTKGDDRSGDDAANDTLVFTMRDANALYVALNCRYETASALLSRQNTITYDDLIPRAGELVELLFDPLNAGTRSPSDLYHIAIKPSGSYLVEKGLPFSPPVGRHEPWATGLTVATRVERDRWFAELRIPLASFDNATTENTVWGFNVTRFDAARQTLSTWSGAISNAYDPMSLGNLFLP